MDRSREPFPVLRVLGLMSGTSLDGVDAALIRTDGVTIAEQGPWLTLAYEESVRERLRAALGGGEEVADAEREITLAHARAALALLGQARLRPGDVDVVGFPGHTVAHRPEHGLTWQIGDGARLAELTGIDVVNDFRRRDVAAGGQGAPLAPLYHRALARGLERPLAVLNLGGVANVTWIGEGDDLLAFDTGPGCALIDDWALRHTGVRYDGEGALARAGTVHGGVVAANLAHPYFDRPPPKSLDRQSFGLESVEGLSPADAAATLVAFTAAAARRASEHFPAPPRRWLLCGGGRHNPALMDRLKEELAPAELAPVEAAGWRGDALEAEAFAFLAVRSLRGLPLTLPETTGVRAPLTGGALHRHATVAE